MMSAINRFLGRLRSNEEGAILIETGLVVSMLVLFMILVFDLGSLLLRQMQISNALRAGTQYALVRKPIAGDVNAVRDAVLASAPDGSAPVVTAEIFCACASGAAISCELTCDDGSDRQYFVDVSYEEQFTMLFRYPGMNKTMTLGGNSIMRLN